MREAASASRALAWCSLAAERASPHEIAYFNEIAGGPVGGSRYLADSNLDWGQGLPELKAWMDREGVDAVYLAYFGTDRPEAYGLRYQPLPGYGRVGKPGGQSIDVDAPRQVVAVSVNHVLGMFLNEAETYSWLRDRKPTAIVGGCIYVFDLTGDPAAVKRVRAIARGEQTMSQTLRSLVVLVVGGAAVYFAAGLIVQSPAFAIPKDFLEYWASARLNLRGENPYDPERLLAEQQTADPDRTKAVMMWNPPPALAVYMPLAPVPARWAASIWIALQLLAVMVACDLLWRAYAPNRPRWIAQIVGLSFVGTWWVVAYGQNTGLLLLGLAGFLHATRKEQPVAAGAWAALTALKPHLLAGFGVLLLVDAVTRRGRIAC